MTAVVTATALLIATTVLFAGRWSRARRDDDGRRADANPFGALRDSPAAAQAGRAYVAIAEVERFALLRHRVGFAVANTIMATLTDRLSAALPGVWIGRVGRVAIEFAFTAPDRDQARHRLETARQAMEASLAVDGYRFDLTIMIGAADLGLEPIGEEAIDIAAAMLVEARQEHEPVRIADRAAMRDQTIDVLSLVRELPEAMRAGEVQVYYQPKLRARTNLIDSAEALLRWTHPRLGPVPIEALVRVAEETGAIRALTEWVIERALADHRMLADAGHEMTLYVNISGQLLADPGFAAWALGALGGAAPSIGFEITETAVIGDPERTLAHLQAFRDAGIRLAIDDYGSGLSSLAYLKQLPAQELKIDRLFIKELIDSHRDPLLVRSSIDLAHALEMEVTAEGVDDPMTLALLRIMGCDMVQGYLISPAVPLEELIAIVADTERLATLDAADRNNLAAFGAIWSRTV